jgi:hypothetical protein
MPVRFLPMLLRSANKLSQGRTVSGRSRTQPRHRRVFFESLEDRRVLATLTESGTTLTVTLDNTSESLAISSAGTSYLLSSSNPINDGGITTGLATFGGTLSTVTADGLAAYDTIRVVDATGVQDTKVTFADSGASEYSDHFVIALNQDAFAASGDQSVVFNGTSTFGAFNLNVSTTRNIVVSNSAKVLTSSGSVAFDANPAGTTSGAFTAILVDSFARIETGAAGTIQLSGKVGTAYSVSNARLDGVVIVNNSVVKGGSAGDAVVITGFGGINSGGVGSPVSTGVIIGGFGATVVTSTGGNVRITGQGGSSSDSAGVDISAYEVSAGGAGNLIITGTVGASGGTAGGVELNSNTNLLTAGGNIEVTGSGGTQGGMSGVWMQGNPRINAGGLGNVTVTGTGGTGNGNVSYGIRMVGNNPGTSSVRITSSGGNVQVTGTGGGGTGTSTFNAGIGMLSFTTISAGGMGNVTLAGTGGTSTGNGNHGILMNASTNTITSSGGNVQVTGTAGNGGTRFGISAVPGVISTPAAGGNITLVADSMALGGTGSVNAGTRTVTLRPKTTNGTVGINLGGADAVGVLGLTNEELSRVTAGTLELGGTGAGAVTISSNIGRPSPTVVKLTSAGNIVFNGGSLNTGGGPLTLVPGTSGAVQPNSSGVDASMITGSLAFASGSDLAIAIDGTVVDTQYRQLNVTGSVNLSSADLVLTGTHSPTLGQEFVIVNNDGSDAINGAFNGLPEGAAFYFLGSNLAAMISYQGGTNANDVVLTVVADGPAAIAFNPTPIPENAVPGTVVGTLSTTDPNPNATHTYSLVGGLGDDGNASFDIVGDTLRAAASIDYHTQSSYSVRVRTTNQAGLSFERQVTVNILPDFWAFRAGSSLLDYGSAVATDNAGNSYVTGVYVGTVDFDPGPAVVNLTSGQSGAVFVAKYDSLGRLLWARKFAGNPTDLYSYGNSRGIAVDRAGNVYTTGTLHGTMDFDPGAGALTLTDSNGASAFVSKLDTNGNFVWAKKLGGGSHGNGIALDGFGNVYTVGEFTFGDFDPGAGTFNLSAGNATDVFVSKLDINGVFVWAKQFVGSGAVDIGNDIAVDSSGNVYATGRFFAANTDFDPGPGVFALTPAGNYDGFLTKLDATGAFVWAKQWGGILSDEGNEVAVDGLGNVYLYGTGAFNLAPTTINGQFLAKFDGSGNYVWASRPGGSAVADLVINGLGEIYLIGSFIGTVDFDPGVAAFSLASSGAADIFVTNMSSGGQFLWAKTFGGPSDDYGIGVAVDGAGMIVTTGYFTSMSADFKPGFGEVLLSGEVNGDIFVSKLYAVADADGISDAVEDGGPNGGDGNNDNIPDSSQDNVTSFPTVAPGAEEGAYVTLQSAGGTTLAGVVASEVENVPVAPPAGVEFPVGVLTFTIEDVPGDFTELTLYLPDGVVANTYYKYGPTPDNSAPHWYEFLYDDTLPDTNPNYGTGAEFVAANIIILHFRDGFRGDNDLFTNGTIADPGSPGFVVNTQPAFTSATFVSISEGNAAVQNLVATDTDLPAQVITYSITGGADQAQFQLVDNHLQFISSPNFETAGDADGNNVYLVQVKADDGNGGYVTQTVSVSVTNVEPSVPTDSNAAADSVAEGAANGTTVGITANSLDPNGPAVIYSLTDDAGGRFAIHPTTGVVTVANGGLLDFETATSHTITVKASDGAAGTPGTSTQNFTITIANVAPAVPTDADAAADSVAEGAANGTTVGITANSLDPNGPAVIYSLTDDAGGRFAIHPTTGVVTVANGGLLDFETATSHTITVKASDGAAGTPGTSTQNFTIAITNVAPAAPTDEDAAADSVAEGAANGTAVGITAASADPNGPAVTYSLTDDAGGRFAIHPTTGVVTVANGGLLDFETATSHTITVKASDGAAGTPGTSMQNFTIAVTNVTAVISGTIFVDADGDGLFDGGTESAIDAAIVELLDNDGNLLDTDETLGGVYSFIVNDEFGTYRIREIQPSGVTNGAAILGDANGNAITGEAVDGVVLSSNEMRLTLTGRNASDYDFTEIGQAVQAGDTAGIGFWQNKNGQALIKQGGPALVTWLSANFGNIFGNTFSNGSGGDDAAEVASFYKFEFFSKKLQGTSKVDAQFMATALATFFTSSNLSGSAATSFGFNVTATGIGTKVVNIGGNGAAFDVANNTTMTIMALLLMTNNMTGADNDANDSEDYSHVYDTDGDGVLDTAEKALRAMANNVYAAINESGGI